jgi:hypothetical protein
MSAFFKKNKINIQVDINQNVSDIMQKLDKKIISENDRFTNWFFEKDVNPLDKFTVEKFPEKYIPSILEYYKISDMSELSKLSDKNITVHFSGGLMIPRFCVEYLLFNITQKDYILDEFEFRLLSNIITIL